MYLQELLSLEITPSPLNNINEVRAVEAVNHGDEQLTHDEEDMYDYDNEDFEVKFRMKKSNSIPSVFYQGLIINAIG